MWFSCTPDLMEFFYTDEQSFGLVWQDDIPSPIDNNSSMSCEEFAATLEVTVDQLWAM
jgi:hypothetical protein